MDTSIFTGKTFKGQKPQKALVTHLVNEMTEILQKVPQTPIGLTTIPEDQFSKLHQKCPNRASSENRAFGPFLSPAQLNSGYPNLTM